MPIFHGFTNGNPADNEKNEELLRKSKTIKTKIWKEEFERCSTQKAFQQYLDNFSDSENPYIVRAQLMRNELRRKEEIRGIIITIIITILFIAGGVVLAGYAVD